MRENTHITEIRERYESNRLFILRATGITEAKYNELMFEQAMAFLDLEYPFKTEFEKCRPVIYKDPVFWQWWKAIYKKHEDDFVQFIKDINGVFTVKYYKEEMEQITHESRTAQIFYQQYQKPMYESAKRHWREVEAG